MTNKEIIKDYKNDLYEEGLDKKTIKAYVSSAQKIVDVVDKEISEADIADIKKIRSYFTSKKYADTQYNKAIMHCNRFFGYLLYMKTNANVDKEQLKKIFKLKKVKNTDKHGEKPMSIEEFENFYSFLYKIKSTKFAQRRKVGNLLACGTGLRSVEIAELRIDAIDFENKCVDPNKTKFDKGRSVKLPLTDDILEEIRKLLEIYGENDETGSYLFMTTGEDKVKKIEEKLKDKDLLFLEREALEAEIEHILDNGWHVSTKTVGKWVKNACNQAIRLKIIDEVYTPHAIRKSKAKWMYYVGGFTIEEIAEFFGHSSTETTRGYVFDEKVVASTENRIELSRKF